MFRERDISVSRLGLKAGTSDVCGGSMLKALCSAAQGCPTFAEQEDQPRGPRGPNRPNAVLPLNLRGFPPRGPTGPRRPRFATGKFNRDPEDSLKVGQRPTLPGCPAGSACGRHALPEGDPLRVAVKLPRLESALSCQDTTQNQGANRAGLAPSLAPCLTP